MSIEAVPAPLTAEPTSQKTDRRDGFPPWRILAEGAAALRVREVPVEGGRLFEAAGIAELDEMIYRLLLQRPGCSAAELAALCSVSSQRVRMALQSLQEKGLASRAASKESRFVPARPDVAIEVLVLRRQEELEHARLAAYKLLEDFHAAVERTNPVQLVEVIVGRAAMVQKFEQIQRRAEQEVQLFDKPPYALAVNETELELLQKGISYLVVYDSDAFKVSGQLHNIGRLTAAGEEARVHSGLPMKLAIADRKVALVPLTVDEPGIEGGAVIHASSLLSALRTLFQVFWDGGAPIRLSQAASEARTDDSVLDREHQEVLVLLAAGLTDETIARQLRLGPRTVQRRVRRMMDVLGAGTRFQAGLLAAKRGWLEGSSF